MNIINIYTDASIKNKITIGIYIVFDGLSMTSRRIFKKNTNDCNNNTCMAELIGINAGLEFCLKDKYSELFKNKIIIINNDNLNAVNKINFNKTKICIKNIKKIKEKLNSNIDIRWIPRKNNNNADKLAKKYYKYL